MGLDQGLGYSFNPKPKLTQAAALLEACMLYVTSRHLYSSKAVSTKYCQDVDIAITKQVMLSVKHLLVGVIKHWQHGSI